MSAGRTTMIGGGSGLIALGSLALLARYLEMGSLSAAALGQPEALYHTLTVGTVLSGLILVIFAPPTRRTENRVRLDMPHRHGQPAQTPQPSTAKVEPVAAGGPAPVPAVQRPAQRAAAKTPGTNGASPPQARPAAPAVAAATHPDDLTTGPLADPRESLHSRLDELNRRANEIKVRFGLGKVSPGGYRKFIEELDVERSKIEARLMEPEQ